ncbi:hypothetical protein V493_05845 [Pseudogymnoascus sp. VKM F-4281 (FW-2241)]|nr:hypothetical protein V493_05845 [Pseudogymnoascus sp. VKM F-4281 (FW-2241)]
MQPLILIAGLLALGIEGSQPSAPKPVAAPMRELPWGQLNFLATTDTHGWLGGHLQESQYSADWGDYISFTEHMRADADRRGVDLLVVDTGDRVDGNGLYDGSAPKGLYTNDILQRQDIDILCSGNHELYKVPTSEREYNETVANFPEQYIASNIDILHPETGKRVPLSRRYRHFKTKNQGIHVLAFGFLFDFTGNAHNSFVQRVEDTVKEEWFQQAIREHVDIFVVVGHVPPHSPEYQAVFSAIRSQNWDTPIQFFSGHSHVRDFAKMDDKAYALQSGRYMETVGWMSVDGIKIHGDAEVDAARGMKFQRRYIDNNLFGYHHHTGLNASTFPTERGINASLAIASARKSMKLDKVFGCAPQDFWVNRSPYPSPTSIFSLLVDSILPDILTPADDPSKPRIAIFNTGGLRFDIFKGTFTKDTTYLLSPFDNTFRVLRDVPWDTAKKVLPLINAGGHVFTTESHEEWRLAPPQQIRVQQDFVAEEVSAHQPHGGAQVPLGGEESEPIPLIPGYTTVDDAGKEGDDTAHAPLSFYRVPNVVEARMGFPGEGEPETVDLVFVDFVEPWVLLALRFAGKAYEKDEVEEWMGGRGFTHMLTDWVAETWGKGDGEGGC